MTISSDRQRSIHPDSNNPVSIPEAVCTRRRPRSAVSTISTMPRHDALTDNLTTYT